MNHSAVRPHTTNRLLKLILSTICVTYILSQVAPSLPASASGKGDCADLSGTYLVTTEAQNEVVEYEGKRIVRFPPGLRTLDNTQFTIRQVGCESIQFDYTTRFGSPRRDLVSAAKNGLQWDPADKLFRYSITAVEPDGQIIGSLKYVAAEAQLGLDKDNFLVCQFKIHQQHLWFGLAFLAQNSVYSERFRFERVSDRVS